MIIPTLTRYTAAMFTGLLILLATAWCVLVVVFTAVLAYKLCHPPRLTEGVALARGMPADPGEAGAKQWHVWSVQDSDGQPVEVWDVGGGNYGPIVVMLHGWVDGRIGQLQWLELLTEAANHVVQFDMRAHGVSRRRVFTWGLREAADVRVVVQAMTERYPGRPVVLFGYSLGATLAMRLAVDLGEQVSGVIVDSPFETVEGVIGRVFCNRRLPVWPIVPLALAVLRAAGWMPKKQRASALAAGLRCPLLVLHGHDDSIAPLPEAEAIAGSAAKGRIEVFDGCDHLQAGCAEPQRYAQVVRSFYQEI